MSRSLEVLEQVQVDQRLFGVKRLSHAKPSVVCGTTFQTDGCVLGLAQRLFLATNGSADATPRRVVFSGIDEVEGANVLCARLGRILASQVASQVCIVDANVRTPMLHRLLKMERSDNQTSPQPASYPRWLEQIASNLWLISSHSTGTNGGVTASLDKVQSQIKELPLEFGFVVINAPPVGMYIDAALLGKMAEGIVLVLEANSTRRVAALKAKQTVEAAGVRVLGTVLNNRAFPIPERIYRLL